MSSVPVLAFLLALQQPSMTTPPSGDTTGYWQQRLRYVITATLDEPRGALAARGELTYVNSSPDTLRELYVHQYLNAFRPGSEWSEADERERRVRFQNLRDPDYAYERFTATPTIDGVAVSPEYPGAPDSTVVHFRLPRPLVPGDSLRATFEWEARPSTLPRRQGRKGRTFDFAHWFPKPAVYDRGGWQPNPLVPAGEFYGEFGEYDVTLVVPGDQVIGSTGVAVSGDPGWRGALRWGTAHHDSAAYQALTPRPVVRVPDAYKAVRFVARDVHHFGWSASPDYRYEGGVYVRERPAGPGPGARVAAWDSVPVHVLYKPGDEEEWGGGKVVERTLFAVRWLERIYGPYAYPQMTVLHRIEQGGTEFPMLQMNGSASQGLVLHEGGHVYSYGILANNEWQSGWMDEGLTSYQTSWAQGKTRRDFAARRRDSSAATRSEAPPVLTVADSLTLAHTRLVLLGRAQPIGLRADQFSQFAIYNAMIYGRAEQMYSALHDVLGDSAFAAFLHDYYARWALRHVDERAMRASAERAYGGGRELGWFFDQWVRRVGLIDYALRDVTVRREGGGWVTRARLEKVGDYFHPMPVGVLTPAGWTVVRGEALRAAQEIVVRTADEPVEVRLDPFESTEDWYAPNYVFPRSRRSMNPLRASPLERRPPATQAAGGR
jgi:hypothetical protein